MNRIDIKGFTITSPGDPSVGIFSARWDLTNGFIFDTQEDLEVFRKALKEAFESVADDVYVETFEEIEAREKELMKGFEE